MEYVTKIIIFGLKMMVKSGLEKFILISLYSGNYFSLLHKMPKITNSCSAWRDFKIDFSRPLFTIIFRPKRNNLGTYSILRVKKMVEFLIYYVLIVPFFLSPGQRRREIFTLWNSSFTIQLTRWDYWYLSYFH